MFESINFRNCEVLYIERDSTFFKEDLLQGKFLNSRLIDVGWYGDDFCIQVIEDFNWENPSYKLNTSKIECMEKVVQDFIDYETIEYPDEISSLFCSLKKLIRAREGNRQQCLDDATEILKELHSLGLDQNEVANYIGTYALQYREDNEDNWNFARDLLDLITGVCAPQKHIWRSN
ncbi:hypothetical protein IA938_08525 [Listeria welshimeri]|uniref:hypothetical protein n=1 Tax=Listeria welshimeri TaxID=1643 RepID=UPI001625D0BA|nr:hypothetical protein [Listeria welshimeri]MBC2063694.1 hypothetical protein [Listeria welshimeri]MBC2082330.1 hypothetical protein [Listeria welshimeri]MBF2387312.1 hypothetical protein [Listeria welshimeri]MBF2411766.1 hypothetical protein [Listeria welshimeri]MBF2445960.1 hypothetical protein [Listeria welshimeri]